MELEVTPRQGAPRDDKLVPSHVTTLLEPCIEGL